MAQGTSAPGADRLGPGAGAALPAGGWANAPGQLVANADGGWDNATPADEDDTENTERTKETKR